MKNKSALLVVGGAVAVLVSAIALRKFQIYRSQEEFDESAENDRKIDRYEDYVHSPGAPRANGKTRGRKPAKAR